MIFIVITLEQYSEMKLGLTPPGAKISAGHTENTIKITRKNMINMIKSNTTILKLKKCFKGSNRVSKQKICYKGDNRILKMNIQYL